MKRCQRVRRHGTKPLGGLDVPRWPRISLRSKLCGKGNRYEFVAEPQTINSFFGRFSAR